MKLTNKKDIEAAKKELEETKASLLFAREQVEKWTDSAKFAVGRIGLLNEQIGEKPEEPEKSE